MKEKLTIIKILRANTDISDLGDRLAKDVSVVKCSSSNITFKNNKPRLSEHDIDALLLTAVKDVIRDNKETIKQQVSAAGYNLKISELELSLVRSMYDVTVVGNRVNITLE